MKYLFCHALTGAWITIGKGMGMEMSMIETIKRRHSYRGQYRPEPVPRRDLVTIMEAGLAAPSGCNMQTTSLICVDDPKILNKIHEFMTRPMGQTAPALICILTRRINSYHGRCFAVQDYSAAIENMLLEIVDLGYQSCWYEGYVTDEDGLGEKIAGILKVPNEYELVCVLPIGIADSEITGPRKKEFGERAWFNSFPDIPPMNTTEHLPSIPDPCN